MEVQRTWLAKEEARERMKNVWMDGGRMGMSE
jgi:hypothetical protein